MNNLNNGNDIIITIVYDNYPHVKGLQTNWGFSCVIQFDDGSLLFDTGGNGPLLLENMQKLEIKPSSIQSVFLSHYHGDHTGGITDFLKSNSNVNVYLPQSFPDNFKKVVYDNCIKLVEISDQIKIGEQVYSTGEMGIRIIEQSLIVQTANGLIVITGCAHPGIVQIINQVKRNFEEPILLAMGGFHLRGVNESEIVHIISELKNLGVHYVAPTHCSGDAARSLFKKEYQQSYLDVGVGSVIHSDELEIK